MISKKRGVLSENFGGNDLIEHENIIAEIGEVFGRVKRRFW